MKNFLLKDKEKLKELNTHGFTTIKLLNESKVNKLREYYHKKHPDGAPEKIDGIHMTTWCTDLKYKTEVSDFISKMYSEACEDHFQDYRVLNNVFIVKDPGETPFKVHQDWNVVDESQYSAINVWVPLYDVSEKEGALWVLKGSHKIDRHVRGSAYLFPDYSPFFDELERSATSVELKAGEAIIFYVNIIHGSPPNYGDKERIATCFAVIPKKAPLNIYFQKEKDDPLEIHEPSDDFVYHYSNLRTETFERAPTDNPVKVESSFENTPVSFEEIRPYLKKKSNKGLFARILDFRL